MMNADDVIQKDTTPGRGFISWCPQCHTVNTPVQTFREWVNDDISDCPVEVDEHWFVCCECSHVWDAIDG